ncbi:MAG: hypothetical protein WCT37_03990 [Patescibacteria group bacterium]|jgi:hypothetical protein
MNKIILDTENLYKQILKSAKTISDQKIKKQVENWLINYYNSLNKFFDNNEKGKNALDCLKSSSTNSRLIRKRWLTKLNFILKTIKENKYSNSINYKNTPADLKEILQNELLIKIKKVDNKVYILGKELNQNWDSINCWNSCGILMRVILERSLDKKGDEIKNKNGLKNKINFCLSSNIFGRSVLEALKKLDNSTKITGDIVAHDSNILLIENDIELAIIPFRVLLSDIF